MNPTLLSTDAMYDRLREVPHNQVYFFTISGEGGQQLYYLGSHHTHDPENTQFREIEELFDRFIQSTNEGERQVLVESAGQLPQYTDRDIAIKRSREVGFTALLARQKGVEVISPEPTKIEEVKLLLQQYSKDEVFYHLMSGICWNYSKMKSDVRSDFMKYIKFQLEEYAQMEEFKDFDLSIEHFLKMYKSKYPDTPFNYENTKLFYDEQKPAVGNISEASSKIRDEVIVRKIEELWKQGKSIFIVYGLGHAIVQEQALKDLLD